MAIVIDIVVMILLLFGATKVLTASIQDFSTSLPDYQAGLQKSVASITPTLARIGITTPENGSEQLRWEQR